MPLMLIVHKSRRNSLAAIREAAGLEKCKADAEELMAWVDQLPPGWRKLVHEYGTGLVSECYREGMSLSNTSKYLSDLQDRNNHQADTELRLRPIFVPTKTTKVGTLMDLL